MTIAKQNNGLIVAALGLILAVAAGVRFHDLDVRTITHPELYVPGIELPANLVETDLPRLTVGKVVSGCINHEPRPPLWYVLMLGWTKVAGTGIFALRLPAVVCGIASIVLIYVLGLREGGEATGLVAAGMLALNGHHVFWSQSARSFAVVCCLGLLSTVLLVRMARGGSRSLGSLFLYGVSTLAGLAMEIFLWPVFLTQILWVAGKGAKGAAVLSLLRWQLLLFLAASPLCALAVHQSKIPSHAVGEPLTFLGQFLQFGFLFEPDYRMPLGPLATAATFVLPLLALVLVGVGLVSKGEDEETEASVLSGPPTWLWLSVELAALGSILVLGGRSYASVWSDNRRTAAILATALIPVSGPLVDRLLRRSWPLLQGDPARRWLAPAGWVSLSGLLAVVPITMIFAISPVVPLFASRGILLFTPYLIVTAARGFVALVGRDLRWLAIGLVLAVVHPWSVYHWHQRPTSPRDYKALTRELATRLKESDLIFVRGNWWQTSPIFYYLKADRYRFVGKDYSEEIATRPRARVWAVAWEDNSMPPEMIDALRDYHRGDEIEVWGARAVLYTAPSDKLSIRDE